MIDEGTECSAWGVDRLGSMLERLGGRDVKKVSNESAAI
jgi:hypothetical protein